MTSQKDSPRPARKSRKEFYKQRYDAAKIGGESFFPDTIVRDAIVALILFVIIIVLALVFPATSQPPADPTALGYNPRPEWYFLFFFQFLKFFPGSLEPLAAAVIPALALIALIFVPFLDRNPQRRWAYRKGALGVGTAAVLFLVSLEIAGWMSAPATPAGQESPAVQAGQMVYQEFNCSYCHAINGVGGAVGPDLSSIGATSSQEKLSAYLSNPNSMIPNTLHPKLLFTPDELNNLVAYLLTLGAPVQYSSQAPTLFASYCSSCHAINGKGGDVGPDLSAVGSRRSVSFIEAFITDPRAVIAGTTMPAFKDKLSSAQIQDIAAYLYSLKTPSSTATPTPTPSPTPTTPPPTTGQVSTFGQLAQPGKSDYDSDCGSCHGAQGEGASAPALWGSNVSLAYYGTAQKFFDYISRNMPPGEGGTLSHQDYLNILGYILVQGNQVSPSTAFNESNLGSVTLK